jgi:hypothetical protein
VDSAITNTWPTFLLGAALGVVTGVAAAAVKEDALELGVEPADEDEDPPPPLDPPDNTGAAAGTALVAGEPPALGSPC